MLCSVPVSIASGSQLSLRALHSSVLAGNAPVSSNDGSHLHDRSTENQAAQTSIQATVSLYLTTRYAFIRASADGSEFRDYDLLEQVMPTIPTHTHSRDTASLPHFAFAEIACCVLVRNYLRDCIISSKILHTSDGHVWPFV